MNLLEVQDLAVRFPVRAGQIWTRKQAFVHAVRGVSFSLGSGETLGLVGESGCGKTTLGRSIVRLVRPTSGRILFEGQDTAGLKGAALRAWRRQCQMVFQDPYNSLDPRLTAADIVGEALDIHGLAPSRDARRRRVATLLDDVGLDVSHALRYPHEFSGGQRQRIGIARALAVRPRLLVCDEPVSSLDVSVQAQIVNLLRDLQREHGMAYLFIAHDLALVEHVSHRVLVMYLGRIMESGEAKAVCRRPKHPYTQALVSAVPTVDASTSRTRIVLSGEVPSPVDPPSGCPFHPRCPAAEARCRSEVPVLRPVGPGRSVACHLA